MNIACNANRSGLFALKTVKVATMIFFILTYLSLYGGAHLYLLLKVRHSLLPGWGGLPWLSAFVALMVLAPILTRVCERAGLELVARIMAHAGYVWMGLFFAAFSAAFMLDLYRLLLYLAGRALPWDLSFLTLSGRTSLLLALCWGGFVALYGYFEARTIRIERLTMESAKLPVGSREITIAQVSDVHLGMMLSPDRLERIVAGIRGLAPDILVSTGDLVDGDMDGLESMVAPFRELTPPLGKYAVTGNHEVYAGLGQALDFMKAAGFSTLRDEHQPVTEWLTIAGVDDPAVDRSREKARQRETRTLAAIPARAFTLLLKHRPVIQDNSPGTFDLQLSGHVHKGQIWPFNFLTWLNFPVKAGFTQYPKGSALYVSRGTGTWGPPIRFLAPPEITLITLRPPRP
jgi:predicted MPP superfamily phosphohydrolase